MEQCLPWFVFSDLTSPSQLWLIVHAVIVFRVHYFADTTAIYCVTPMFPPSSTYAHCHAPAPAATVTFFYERKLRAQKDACCTRLASLCCRIFTAKNCLRHLHGSTALFCSLPSAPPISPTIQTNPSQKSPYSHFSTRNMFSKGEFLFYLSFCLAGYRSGFNLWCKTKVLVGYSPRRRLHLLFPLRCVLVRSWRRLKFKVF